jgi:large conductance mechanosensitive channel
MDMMNDFKKFLMRGNVLDLAVAVVIGGAFGKIVSSLVNDIIMPLLGVITRGVNFSALKYVITPESEEIAELAITYGAFIQSIIDFIIIALSIFMVIRFMVSLQKKKEEKPPAPPEPSNEEKLLIEIRDILSHKNEINM